MADRFLNFVAIGYQDSINQDFEEILSREFKFCYILHDNDIMEDGKPKKPHYHFIITCPFQKTYSAFKKVITDLQVGLVLPPSENECGVHSKVSAEHYLTHENNSDKFHYDREDIKCCNGYRLGSVLSQKEEEQKKKQELLCSIIKHINDGGFTSFEQIYCEISVFEPDMLMWLSTKAFFIQTLLKSHYENKVREVHNIHCEKPTC